MLDSVPMFFPGGGGGGPRKDIGLFVLGLLCFYLTKRR
jgi:hypothetical protein